MSVRSKTYGILETGGYNSLPNKIVKIFIITLIVANVAAVIVESYQPLGNQYKAFFNIFELISVAIFTVEYLIRLWASVEDPDLNSNNPVRSRLRYLVTPTALIDLLAILPFYLSFFITIDLRHLRMLRMLRLLKLTHYFKGLNLFASVLQKEMAAIGSAILTMIVLVIFAASIMYGIEHNAQPEAFDNIPSAIWWAVVTMTTVGYGDVTPVTFMGKFISIFIMLVGVGIVALPAAMLAAKFSDELQLRKELLEAKVSRALEDGVISNKEHHNLAKLTEDLDLSPDVLDRMIRTGKLKRLKTMRCPHCNKDLFDGLHKP